MTETYEEGYIKAQIDSMLAFATRHTVAKSGIADFVCSNYNSDAECFQAALDAANSGDTISVLEGTYTITSQVSQSGKNFNIIGIGNVVININTGSQDPAFWFHGSAVTTQKISANSATGSITVTLASASNVQVGDIIDMHNNVLWSEVDYATLITGEIYLVSGVSGNVVTLNQPLIRDYSTADSSEADIYRPIKLKIENIQFNNHSPTENVIGLMVEICKESSVQYCTFENHGLTALRLEKCYDFSIQKCTIRNSNVPGFGYGICISGASACIQIITNYIENCRHCVTSSTEDHVSLNRAIIISDNIFIGSNKNLADGNIVDSHPCTIDYTVVNNIFYPYNGLVAFYDATQNSTFSNNFVCGNAVARRGNVGGGVHILANNRVDGGYLYLGANHGINKSISITSNIVRNCDYGIRTVTEAYENYEITNNTICTCSIDGVDVTLPRIAMSHANVLVSGNNITSTKQNGMVIQCESASYKIYGNITANVIRNVNLDSGYFCGIKLNDIYGANVANNLIINDIGAAYRGIREQHLLEVADWNYIHDNIIIGATSSVQTNGVHTVAINNITPMK